MYKKIALATAVTAVLAGCATPTITSGQMSSIAAGRITDEIEKFETSARPRPVVREISETPADFKKTQRPAKRGDITMRAAAVPVGPLLSELAEAAGYSIAFGENVNIQRPITVNFNEADREDAIRTSAFLAGYVAIFDKTRQTVLIAEKGTYTYKVPTSIFSALQAQYSVGGNPANAASSGGGSGGGGGGGSAGGTTLKAEFTVTGKEQSNPQGLTAYLSSLAGAAAEVYVNDTGHITVRGGATALKRVGDFLAGFIEDAMTQVEIEASVVEVALQREFSMGIQWGKVMATSGVLIGGGAGALAGSNASAALLNAAAAGSANGLSAFRVGADASTIIQALARFTDVRVVSQPRLVSLNNVPANFFDGLQLPYLGSVEQTQGDGGVTVTGEVAFAVDGVSFSAIPSVVNKDTVQITLIPVLSNVAGMESFLQGTITAPRQANKQTYMRVLAESGKTLILGGIRYNKDTKDTAMLNWTNANTSAKEIVILLKTNIIPAPKLESIVQESL